MPRKSQARKKLTRKESREAEVKIGFLEGVVRRDPAFADALRLLGDLYTANGQFEDGLRIDEELSGLEPDDPLVFYNLACSYSLTGQLGRSALAIDRALALGYRDFHWLARDPDLRALRNHPIYEAIREKIRKIKIEVI